MQLQTFDVVECVLAKENNNHGTFFGHSEVFRPGRGFSLKNIIRKAGTKS